MRKILVMDASSILAFNYYYAFDRGRGDKVYDTLLNFIMGKIESGNPCSIP